MLASNIADPGLKGSEPTVAWHSIITLSNAHVDALLKLALQNMSLPLNILNFIAFAKLSAVAVLIDEYFR